MGLPPSASWRITESKKSGLRSSLLSARDWASIESAEFDPVGSVVGCRAERVDWGEFGLGEVGCGYVPRRIAKNPWSVSTGYNRSGGTGAATSLPGGVLAQVPQLAATSASTPSLGAGSRMNAVTYTHAATAPTRSAIERMLLEASELGADGVVAVEISHTEVGHGVWECTAWGTAVRARGSVHARRPFVTTLSGADSAKLLRSGFIPASVAVGMTMAITHDLRRAQLARNRFSSVREVAYITELVTMARSHARGQVNKAVSDAGADGAILTSQMTLSIEEHRVNRRHHDIVAQVTAVASSIVSFEEASPGRSQEPPLTVLRLRPV